MKKEIQIILTADKGKHLTDGENFCTEIRLPQSADETLWHEITEEEYAEIVSREGVEDA